MTEERVWMRPPWGTGEPKHVEATPDVLVPLMTAGWTQCGPPVSTGEESSDVHD
jgi:hypothetical protein